MQKKESIEKLSEKIKRKKFGRLTDINGIKRKFEVGRFVTQRASEYRDKVFILEEISTPWRKTVKKKGLKLFRLGYYIIGKKPKTKGKWVWGQYAPFITDRDLKELIKNAEKEGIL